MILCSLLGLGIPACQSLKSRKVMSPLLRTDCTGGRMLRLASRISSFIKVSYGPRGSSGGESLWSSPVVWAWVPSQNSVEPFSGLKSTRGMFAIMNHGHWFCQTRMQMEKSNGTNHTSGWSIRLSLCTCCLNPTELPMAVFAVKKFQAGRYPNILHNFL